MRYLGGHFRKCVDYIGVNLPDGQQPKLFRVNGGLKQPPVLKDIFATVPTHETEVQGPMSIDSTDATVARTETVDQPRKPFEGRQLQNSKAARAAKRPGRRKRPRRSRVLTAPPLTRAARRRGCFGHGHSLNSILRTCSRRKTTRPQRPARGALRQKPIAKLTA